MELSKAALEGILKKPYERVLIPEEEGGFSAYIPEFEGCIAQGETADEALNTLHDTAIEWIESEVEAGKEIPEAWNLQQFSGKILLRLPKSLHQELAKLANKEGVSLNQYLVFQLSAAAGEKALLAALDKRLGQTRILENIPYEGSQGTTAVSGRPVTSFSAVVHTAFKNVVSGITGPSAVTVGSNP